MDLNYIDSDMLKVTVVDSIFYVPYSKEDFEDKLYIILENLNLHTANNIFVFANTKFVEDLFGEVLWDEENDISLGFKVGKLILKFHTIVTIVSTSQIGIARGIIINTSSSIEINPQKHKHYKYETFIKNTDSACCKLPSIVSTKHECISANNMVIDFYSHKIQNNLNSNHKILPSGKVITLCGFKEFKNEFLKAEKMLTLAGNIVLNIFQFELSEDELGCDSIKELLSLNHTMKIDISDEIFVIDLDGYVDIETKKLISYALTKKKHIRYITSYE